MCRNDEFGIKLEAVDGYPKGRCPIDSGTVGQ